MSDNHFVVKIRRHGEEPDDYEPSIDPPINDGTPQSFPPEIPSRKEIYDAVLIEGGTIGQYDEYDNEEFPGEVWEITQPNGERLVFGNTEICWVEAVSREDTEETDE